MVRGFGPLRRLGATLHRPGQAWWSSDWRWCRKMSPDVPCPRPREELCSIEQANLVMESGTFGGLPDHTQERLSPGR